MKPTNILVSNKYYVNITDAAKLTYDHKKTTQYNANSLILGNLGHWFVKQELFEEHEPNICNVARYFIWHQSSFLENITLNKQSKIYWKLVSGKWA